jgi:DNA-binding IclR family transcriptional regulator
MGRADGKTVRKKIDAPVAMELGKGNAISKVCAVMSTLSARSPLRLNEISEATGLNRVTALRILEELSEFGFLQRSGNPPRYDFGPEVVAIAGAASRSLNIREMVRPSLLRLADMSGDTVLLSVRSNAEAICVDRVTGDYPIRANFLDIGSRRALGVGGGSMALLASMAEVERDAILEITCRRLSSYPRLSREVLLEHIGFFEANGYVAMYDVVVDKMGAVGYPVRDAHGTVVGSISIVALSERIRERQAMLIERLTQEAKIIKKLLSA